MTDSREGIQSGSEYNKKMISNLAQLSADALKCFVEIGEKHGVRIIDDDIIKIIPTKSADFEEVEELPDSERGAGGFGSTGSN